MKIRRVQEGQLPDLVQGEIVIIDGRKTMVLANKENQLFVISPKAYHVDKCPSCGRTQPMFKDEKIEVFGIKADYADIQTNEDGSLTTKKREGSTGYNWAVNLLAEKGLLNNNGGSRTLKAA